MDTLMNAAKAAGISKWTAETRIRRLKAMHEMVVCANDENLTMRWLSVGVPDCPTEDDFLSIATDSEEYDRIKKLFLEIITDKGYE